LSKEYQVISKSTAFIGVMKHKGPKSAEGPVLVEINKVKHHPPVNHHGGFNDDYDSESCDEECEDYGHDRLVMACEVEEE
jgi:hypothetical protein